ncbi:DNA pilot protein [Microviridae sp.]|nr:DNA pilot protein [Microviridae sp.]
MGLFSGFSLSKIAAPLVSGGLSLVGGLLSNNANSREAETNRNFQAEQSGTAYQRAVTDMRAAGLNPALAYQQGGASTPAGSTASHANPAENAVNSAMAAARLKSEISNIQADTKQKHSTEKLNEAARLNQLQQAKANASNAKKLSIEATNASKLTPIYDLGNQTSAKGVNTLQKTWNNMKNDPYRPFKKLRNFVKGKGFKAK